LVVYTHNFENIRSNVILSSWSIWHISCQWALYNCSLGICFFLYKNLSSWFKQYKLRVQYNLTQVVSYASPGWDSVGLFSVTDYCVHNPKIISNWECVTEEANYCMLWLLQQFGLIFIWNLEF
jgi:hypothetical protein